MDKIMLIVIVTFLFLVILARYNYTKEHPQCFYARDVVTCIEVIRGNNDR